LKRDTLHDTIAVNKTMKTSHIFGIALAFILLVFVLAATANIDQSKVSAKNLGAASLSMQVTTPTPPAQGVSVVGSTDGIVIMGFVIAIIVTLPVLFHKRKK
jgi:hypothetical protein